MTTYDLTPLFRSTIGFDRMSRLLDSALKIDGSAQSYPPYNIIKTGDNEFRISIALAGFSEGDVEVSTNQNVLTVRGRMSEEDGIKYLHRGIAGRAFERRFQLADHVRVREAKLANGLLDVSLYRELPEALRPRMIPVNGRTDTISTGDNAEVSANLETEAAK